MNVGTILSYRADELDFDLLQRLTVDARQQEDGTYHLYIQDIRISHEMVKRLPYCEFVNGFYVIGNRAYTPERGFIALYTAMNRKTGDLVYSLRRHIQNGKRSEYTRIFAISDNIVITNIVPTRLRNILQAYYRGVFNGSRKAATIETAPYRS